MRYQVTIGEETYSITIHDDGSVIVGETQIQVDFTSTGPHNHYSIIFEHLSGEALVQRKGDNVYSVLYEGNTYDALVLDERDLLMGARVGELAADSGELPIKSPMPGLVVSVAVTEGQIVSKGEKVVILESMKMENELKAPRDGMVTQVLVEGGQSVEQHQTLVVIGSEE